MRPTCWHQNFGPNGLSAPAQGLCLNVVSSITTDFNISSAIRWAIQDQWSSGFYLHLSISKGFVSSKIFHKRDDFDFDIVSFPFLDGDIPHSTSYGVYISQLIRFTRVSSPVADFNDHNKSLTAKLLQQSYKLRKTFSKSYRRHHELVSKFSVGLKTLLH